MIGTVVVMEPAQYQAWLAGGGPKARMAERGAGSSRIWPATAATSTAARAAGRH